VQIPVGDASLAGVLEFPADAGGLVLFAHGSGSSRHSPRNQYVARVLRAAGSGTLLFDLLTREEEAEDAYSGHLRFNIAFLAERLVTASRWLSSRPLAQCLPLGYFGSSTGAAAALAAAASLGSAVQAVVSRGGRPDLAMEALPHVAAPTLLIVGERDEVVLQLNEEAFTRLAAEKSLAVVPGATHLFEEPGALEAVARLAAHWFERHWKGTPAG
jgi:putative phosphoribosyl transferase